MGTFRIHLRYKVRRSRHFGGGWAIVDIFTGQPVNYQGFVLDRLGFREVDSLVDILNGNDLKSRGQVHRDL